MAPAPPVIVTTDLDDSVPAAHDNVAGSPTVAQHRRQVSDPSHLSPLAAQNPGFVTPVSTVITPSSPTTSAASSPIDGSTLAPIDEKSSHQRSGSVGTYTTTGTTEKALPSEAASPDDAAAPENDDGKKKKRKLWGRKKKDDEGHVAHLNPDDDKTDPTPFRENPTRLAMLVDPKSLEDLEKIGGIDGVLEGLAVDPKTGLTTTNDGRAPRSGGGSGGAWGATFADRERVYGKNLLPDRPSKSLLELMWIAFKDKVLVSALSVPPLTSDSSYGCRRCFARTRSLAGPRPKARSYLHRRLPPGVRAPQGGMD